MFPSTLTIKKIFQLVMNTENICHHLLTNLDVIMTIGHTLYTTGVTFGAGTGYPSDGTVFFLVY